MAVDTDEAYAELDAKNVNAKARLLDTDRMDDQD